jgi:hypothetical protein
LRFLPAALILLLATACSILNFQQTCSPALRNTAAYTFTIGDQATEAEANLGAARQEDETIIVLRDRGDYQTEITIELVEPLTAGTVTIPDPTASYPSDYIPPITVRGTDPDGNDGGLFFGGITFTEVTDTALSGSFDFTLARPNLEPVMLTGAFTGLELQSCE